MDDASETSQFLEQFTGSASANVLCLVLLGVGMGIKKLCARESRCKTHVHCCCLDVDMRDKTIREKPVEVVEGESNI